MDPIPLVSMCPACQGAVSATENFCPRCGFKLKEPAFSISVGRQTFVYFVAFFLAPFGLGYAYKYLKNPDPKARRVGIVVIILTVLSVLLMLWIGSAFARWEGQLLNNLQLF